MFTLYDLPYGRYDAVLNSNMADEGIPKYHPILRIPAFQKFLDINFKVRFRAREDFTDNKVTTRGKLAV